MEQNDFKKQVEKLLSDDPAKFIKIRTAFDEVFGDRSPGSAKEISDREYERLRYRFRNIDAPLSWCATKEALYQLQKAFSDQRSKARRDEQMAKKTVKPSKKGFFGLFGTKK